MEPVMPRGVSAVLLGLALFVAGRYLEGWLRGLCEGAGVALLLLGVLALSRSRRHGWLPSRDGDER
jgi:hypothetical protein